MQPINYLLLGYYRVHYVLLRLEGYGGCVSNLCSDYGLRLQLMQYSVLLH